MIDYQAENILSYKVDLLDNLKIINTLTNFANFAIAKLAFCGVSFPKKGRQFLGYFTK